MTATADFVLTVVVNAVPCSVIVAAPAAAIDRRVLAEIRRVLTGTPLTPTDILSSLSNSADLFQTLRDSWDAYIQLSLPSRSGTLVEILDRATTLTEFVDILYTAPLGGSSPILYEDTMSHPLLVRIEPAVRVALLP